LLILAAGCRKAPAPPQPAADVFQPYRFDDEFQKAATVSASPVPSSALMADLVVWHNFNSENDVTWILLRGRMGFRQGDLVVKGEGSTPVIQAPGQPLIDWSRYEAVEVRMLAEGGIPAVRAEGLAASLIAACEGAVALARAENSITPFDLVVVEQLRAIKAAIA